jgi:hypothetical protein
MQMASTLGSIFGKGETTNTNQTSRTNSSGSMTGPAPIAPYQAFLPPGPMQGGPVDPTGNMVAGGLGASGNLFQTLAGYLGQNARQNAGGYPGQNIDTGAYQPGGVTALTQNSPSGWGSPTLQGSYSTQ